MLETALYLMDYPQPDYVSAGTHCRIGNRPGIGLMGPWDPARFTVEDSAFGFIRFAGGATLLLETAFALNIGERSRMNVELYGELAGASVFPPIIYTEAGVSWRISGCPCWRRRTGTVSASKALSRPAVESLPPSAVPGKG